MGAEVRMGVCRAVLSVGRDGAEEFEEGFVDTLERKKEDMG